MVFLTNRVIKEGEFCSPNGFKVAFEVDYGKDEKECRFETYSTSIDFSKESLEGKPSEKEFIDSLRYLKTATSKKITERNQCLEDLRKDRKEFAKQYSYAENYFLNVGMYPNEKKSVNPSNVLDQFDSFGSSGISVTTVDEFGSSKSNHMSIYGTSEELANLSKTNSCFTKVLTNLSQLYRTNQDLRKSLVSIISTQNISLLRLLLVFSKSKDPIPNSNYIPLCGFANVGFDVVIDDFLVWNGGLFREKLKPWIDSKTLNFKLEVLKKIAKIRSEEFLKSQASQKFESAQNAASLKAGLQEIQKKDSFFNGL